MAVSDELMALAIAVGNAEEKYHAACEEYRSRTGDDALTFELVSVDPAWLAAYEAQRQAHAALTDWCRGLARKIKGADKASAQSDQASP